MSLTACFSASVDIPEVLVPPWSCRRQLVRDLHQSIHFALGMQHLFVITECGECKRRFRIHRAALRAARQSRAPAQQQKPPPAVR